MSKRCFLGLIFIGFAVSTAWAQSNQMIDALLAQKPAEVGHTAYLVLTAANLIPESATAEQALSTAQERGWVSNRAQTTDPTTFGVLSFLLMEAFEESGGLMYRFFPGPRYAAREVAHQGWARLRRPTGERIDGEVVGRIMSVYLNTRGGAQ